MTFHEGRDFWNVYFERHPELLKAEYDSKIQNLYKYVMHWYDENLPTLNADQSTEFLFNKQEVYDREVKRLFLQMNPDFAREYEENKKLKAFPSYEEMKKKQNALHTNG